MKKILLILFILSFIFTLTSCKNDVRYEAEFLNVFDTLTQIISYKNDKENFQELSDFIYNELYKYHQLFDIYNNYENINNIKTINDNAGKKPVKVDRKIIDLLLFSKEAYIKSEGECNVALGSVLKIWHRYRENGIDDPVNASLPPVDLLHSAAEHTDIDKVIIDTKESTVFLEDPEMSLDVGAVAKGYAVEQVCKKAENQGYTSVLLSVGGNVKAIGSKDGEGSPWNVGIQNPNRESIQPTLINVNIIAKSVVTSGVYERYYAVDGERYHHIIDPETLMPADYFQSVSIICDDSGMADILSTAVFCMPYEDGLVFINSLPDAEAFWVFKDNSVKYSENFDNYMKK